MHYKQTAGFGVDGQHSAPRNVRLLERRQMSRGELDRLRFEALWRMAVKNVCAKNGPQRDRRKPPKARSTSASRG